MNIVPKKARDSKKCTMVFLNMFSTWIYQKEKTCTLQSSGDEEAEEDTGKGPLSLASSPHKVYLLYETETNIIHSNMLFPSAYNLELKAQKGLWTIVKPKQLSHKWNALPMSDS